jgi:hypothetical protein
MRDDFELAGVAGTGVEDGELDVDVRLFDQSLDDELEDVPAGGWAAQQLYLSVALLEGPELAEHGRQSHTAGVPDFEHNLCAQFCTLHAYGVVELVEELVEAVGLVVFEFAVGEFGDH